MEDAIKVVDTAFDTGATASGAGTAIAVVSNFGPAILSTLKAAGGPADGLALRLAQLLMPSVLARVLSGLRQAMANPLRGAGW